MTARPTLAWLEPGSPAESFPDPRRALREPNGLLAAGGDLSPQRLIAAYRHGIFPWFSEGQPILWWCPDPRAILTPDEFHVSRRLRRTLRSGRFEVSVDQRFGEVIRLCAATRQASGTWITADMMAAYDDLHALGFAHSVEVWMNGELAGGVYGIGLGRVFFGESMVSIRADASKVALTKLMAVARSSGISLIDCQMPSAHLARLGSRLMPRPEFLQLLERYAVQTPVHRISPEPTGPAPPG